jgi:hypothetical protein
MAGPLALSAIRARLSAVRHRALRDNGADLSSRRVVLSCQSPIAPCWRGFGVPGSCNGTLASIGSSPTSGGRFLYLDESKIGSVDECAVGGGTLRRLSGSPVSLPTAIALAGIVVS